MAAASPRPESRRGTGHRARPDTDVVVRAELTAEAETAAEREAAVREARWIAARADEVLDSRRPDLAEEITRLTGGVDLVLESVGRATFEASLSVTKPFTGRVVVFGAASGDAAVSTHDLVFTHQVQIKGLHIGALAVAAPSLHQSLLVEIEALIAHGVYPPGTPHVHPLAEGPAVLQRLEAGRTRGKLALDPWR